MMGRSDGLLFSVKQVAELEKESAGADIFDGSLEFLFKVLTIRLGNCPSSVWEFVHFDKLNEVAIETLGFWVILESHNVILLIIHLLERCNIVIGEQIDSILSLTSLWLNEDVELNVYVNYRVWS